MVFAKEINAEAAIVAILSELDSVFTLDEKQKTSTKSVSWWNALFHFTPEFVARNNLIGLGVLLSSAAKAYLWDVCYKNKLKSACTKRTSGTQAHFVPLERNKHRVPQEVFLKKAGH